ncbi:MAG: SDR family NAD(P)-dependent oxidoreductase [Rhodospirillaceae bacterium]
MADHGFTHILITGGSSGIGEALAHAYAKPDVLLSLTGRDAERLGAVARACTEKGAQVESHQIDVGDAAAMKAWMEQRERQKPLDLVIANAGISAGSGGFTEDPAQTRRIMDVNVGGVMNTVLPAIEFMKPRRRGHIAIVSSLAAFRGFAGAPAYGASKAAVRVWGEGLRPLLARDNIGVSVVCPGFVVSRMTAVNRFHMPFLMDADKAARIIQQGITANRGRIAFPWPILAGVWLMATLPDRLADALGRRLPFKD